MDLATVNITKRQAAEAVIAYRHAVRRNRTAEDEQILRGYNQVLRGRKLIQLSEVIKAGGADERHLPRLAVFRADRKSVECRVTTTGDIQFRSGAHRDRAASVNIIFPSDTLPRWTNTRTSDGWGQVVARAIVPLIPPQHRPQCDLRRYHILWEANWTTAPVDPALLQHIGGDLWAVLAVWDLTDLERAVLSARRAS